MRAAGVTGYNAEVSVIELEQPRALREGEVLIEVTAAGVANWDEIVRIGAWEIGCAPPMALGVDAGGGIVAVGEGVTSVGIGDAIMSDSVPVAEQGTWAPRLIARAELLAPKPANVSFDQAGAFPVPALTAEQVLTETVVLQAGETVLVHESARLTPSTSWTTPTPIGHSRSRGWSAAAASTRA
jgi:NADPH:quinone reductase-like Zn-dependent oxidoreductase